MKPLQIEFERLADEYFASTLSLRKDNNDNYIDISVQSRWIWFQNGAQASDGDRILQENYNLRNKLSIINKILSVKLSNETIAKIIDIIGG
jgi:hypothetical protein